MSQTQIQTEATRPAYITKEVHISEIMAGQTIMQGGEMLTVCPTDIQYDSFTGKSVHGDCYRLGTKKVTIVGFPRHFKGKFVGYSFT
jgi:hypothetical protein